MSSNKIAKEHEFERLHGPRISTFSVLLVVECYDYRQAKKVKLVLDNLNTHFGASFYETFSKKQADQILRKIDFYYTPKHGSWLNMAEIEINMMDRECLARRIGDAHVLESEVACWAQARNKAKKKIQWSFTKKDADEKLSKHYVA